MMMLSLCGGRLLLQNGELNLIPTPKWLQMRSGVRRGGFRPEVLRQP